MKNNPKARNNSYSAGVVDGEKILLTGMSELSDVPCRFMHIAKSITGYCLTENFQPDELFFYEITEYISPVKKPNNIYQLERGIGSVERQGKKLYLKRIKPLSSDQDIITRFLDFSPDKKLYINSYVPEDYRELFSLENTIIATEVAGCPSPVELQERTLLGRLNGSIQAIDQNEFYEMLDGNFFSKIALRDNSDIYSSSSKLSLVGKDSIITANYLRLTGVTRRPLKKLKGQLIYNEKYGIFEYWTGKEWRTIVWQ